MSTDEIRAIELLSRVSYGRLATSMRAMPFVAPARHVVADGRVLLRMHRGLGYHRACNGSVVAYGADNCDSGAEHIWSVQFTGTAEIVEPTPEERAAFGPEPVRVDGEPFTPVFLRIEPQFVTLHELDYSGRAGAGTQAGGPVGGPTGGLVEGPAREPAGKAPERPSGADLGGGAGDGAEGGAEDRLQAHPEARPEERLQARAEARPEERLQTASGARPQAGAEERPQAHPGTRPEAHPHPRSVERRIHHAA